MYEVLTKLNSKRAVEVNQITMVLAVRIHELNEYAIQRLDDMTKYWDPMPQVLILDFGSQGKYSKIIKEICNKNKAKLVVYDDYGTFSPAIARNRAIEHIETDYVFFNDIDCFYKKEMFKNIVDFANSIEFSRIHDMMINLPVYHINAQYSEEFLNIENDNEKSKFIEYITNKSIVSEKGKHSDFVAPYSNIFLAHKEYFSLIGGYNESFRGHGSEDFEFLLRWNFLSRKVHLPAEYWKDYYSPLRDFYYSGAKTYKGFRRLFESVNILAELSGLRIAHIHHEKPVQSTWVKSNDWKRNIFNEAVKCFYEDKRQLINQDWMKREKKALILLKHVDQYDMFIPLRLAGYKLELYTTDKWYNLEDYDAIAIFNPYMKSHREFSDFVHNARINNVKIITIERGGLPNSFYYAEDVAYNDPDWSDKLIDFIPTEEQSKVTDEYLESLVSGNETLEALGSYQSTMDKYQNIIEGKKVCFIPLQLSDDMAVNFYTYGYQKYKIFQDQLQSFNANIDNWIFIVKTHPLSKEQYQFNSKVIQCDKSDNIHTLLDIADCVVCYNSGVGLLALAHEKPIITVGNAYYNRLEKYGQKAQSFNDAMDFLKAGLLVKPHIQDINTLYAWLLFYKYSFAKANSTIKDFGDRKSHAYDSMNFYIFNYERPIFNSRLVKEEFKIQPKSYAAAKLHLNIYDSENKDTKLNSSSNVIMTSSEKIIKKGNNIGINKTVPIGKPTVLNPDRAKRLLKKLRKDPKRFFADSEKKSAKVISKIFFSKNIADR
ncbi:capsular polysaccharide export protein, LipB/KpsS family [Psychrobacter arenosus]|uniref:capsular polysaccharide export protein, LipB/KpsS family n=2 Tax=Psychrobacter arenosus TaxID=256326 RepID=UPI00191AE2DD|nr:glycosyltransferase [Psychrobacter arenosus]